MSKKTTIALTSTRRKHIIVTPPPPAGPFPLTRATISDGANGTHWVKRGTACTTMGLKPLMISTGHTSASGWNSTTGWEAKADSVGFISAIIDNSTTLSRPDYLDILQRYLPGWLSTYGGDPNQVYLSGWSAGATDLIWVACHSEASSIKIAGIAPASGWMKHEDDPEWTFGFQRASPIRLFATCGNSGDVVPVEGNTLWYGQTYMGQKFADLNGADGTSPIITTTGVLEKHVWPAVNNAQFYVVKGGNHVWPNPNASDPESKQVDFTDLVTTWMMAGPS